jgi:hypothetical protein
MIIIWSASSAICISHDSYFFEIAHIFVVMIATGKGASDIIDSRA